MTSSLFRRVTRYPVAVSLDPRENRLTEVTAAVLEEVSGFATTFVRHLLAGEGDAERRELDAAETERRTRLQALAGTLQATRIDVRTQVATSQGRFVDLELLLRPALGSPQRGLLVWVEVKHGADLHGDQLDAYLHDVQARAVPEDVARVVALLAPRDWAPEDTAVPPAVVMADWQGVARTVGTVAPRSMPPEQRWLLDHYNRYLKEEGLSDPDALTAVSALSLMEYNRAWDAAAGVCQHADQYVQDHWGKRGSHKQTTGKTRPPAHGPGYYANYDPHRKDHTAAPTWRGAWFEWGMRDTSSIQGLDETRGAWVFMAGATLVTKDDPTKADGNEQWLATRTAEGFQRFWVDYYRFAMLRYPDELLNETTLEQQGRALGAWIVEAFGHLAAHPPPA